MAPPRMLVWYFAAETFGHLAGQELMVNDREIYHSNGERSGLQ